MRAFRQIVIKHSAHIWISSNEHGSIQYTLIWVRLIVTRLSDKYDMCP